MNEILADFFASEPEVLEWGIAKPEEAPSVTRLEAWLGAGYQAQLGYMNRNVEERKDPRRYKSWAKSILIFSLAYPVTSVEQKSKAYKIAKYAKGKDYHNRAKNIHSRLEKRLREDYPAIQFYGFVDASPIFERDWAAQAGLGWRAKNACLINKKVGSGFCLAGALIDVTLKPSQPVQEFCGGCTLCIEACPTQAIVQPGVVDANLCISNWTIEYKGEIPSALSEKFGSWIFGCDICQEVCPWNKKSWREDTSQLKSEIQLEIQSKKEGENIIQAKAEPKPAYNFDRSATEWLLLLRKNGGFQSQFKRTPLLRAGRRMLFRNLCIAMRNNRDESALSLLSELVCEEEDPVLLAEIQRTLAVFA